MPTQQRSSYDTSFFQGSRPDLSGAAKQSHFALIESLEIEKNMPAITAQIYRDAGKKYFSDDNILDHRSYSKATNVYFDESNQDMRNEFDKNGPNPDAQKYNAKNTIEKLHGDIQELLQNPNSETRIAPLEQRLRHVYDSFYGKTSEQDFNEIINLQRKIWTAESLGKVQRQRAQIDGLAATFENQYNMAGTGLMKRFARVQAHAAQGWMPVMSAIHQLAGDSDMARSFIDAQSSPELQVIDEDFFDTAVGMGAATLPFLTVTALPALVFPAGWALAGWGMLSAGAIEGNAAYQDNLLHGVDRETALATGIATGVASGIIEVAFGGSGKYARSLKSGKFIRKGQFLKDRLYSAGKIGGGEMIEESLQFVASSLNEVYNDYPEILKEDGTYDWEQFSEGLKMSALGGLTGSMMLGSVFAAKNRRSMKQLKNTYRFWGETSRDFRQSWTEAMNLTEKGGRHQFSRAEEELAFARTFAQHSDAVQAKIEEVGGYENLTPEHFKELNLERGRIQAQEFLNVSTITQENLGRWLKAGNVSKAGHGDSDGFIIVLPNGRVVFAKPNTEIPTGKLGRHIANKKEEVPEPVWSQEQGKFITPDSTVEYHPTEANRTTIPHEIAHAVMVDMLSEQDSDAGRKIIRAALTKSEKARVDKEGESAIDEILSETIEKRLLSQGTRTSRAISKVKDRIAGTPFLRRTDKSKRRLFERDIAREVGIESSFPWTKSLEFGVEKRYYHGTDEAAINLADKTKDVGAAAVGKSRQLFDKVTGKSKEIFGKVSEKTGEAWSSAKDKAKAAKGERVDAPVEKPVVDETTPVDVGENRVAGYNPDTSYAYNTWDDAKAALDSIISDAKTKNIDITPTMSRKGKGFEVKYKLKGKIEAAKTSIPQMSKKEQAEWDEQNQAALEDMKDERYEDEDVEAVYEPSEPVSKKEQAEWEEDQQQALDDMQDVGQDIPSPTEAATPSRKDTANPPRPTETVTPEPSVEVTGETDDTEYFTGELYKQADLDKLAARKKRQREIVSQDEDAFNDFEREHLKRQSIKDSLPRNLLPFVTRASKITKGEFVGGIVQDPKNPRQPILPDRQEKFLAKIKELGYKNTAHFWETVNGHKQIPTPDPKGLFQTGAPRPSLSDKEFMASLDVDYLLHADKVTDNYIIMPTGEKVKIKSISDEDLAKEWGKVFGYEGNVPDIDELILEPDEEPKPSFSPRESKFLAIEEELARRFSESKDPDALAEKILKEANRSQLSVNGPYSTKILTEDISELLASPMHRYKPISFVETKEKLAPQGLQDEVASKMALQFEKDVSDKKMSGLLQPKVARLVKPDEKYTFSPDEIKKNVASGKFTQEMGDNLLKEFAQPEMFHSDDVQTGKPVTLELFHGSGRKDRDSIYVKDNKDYGVAFPIFAGGKFYTFREDIAKDFGPKTEKVTLSFKNPYVFVDTENLNDVVKMAAEKYNKPDIGHYKDSGAMSLVKRWILEEGHDAIIVNVPLATDFSVRNKSVKKIREFFGATQVWVPTAKPESLFQTGAARPTSVAYSFAPSKIISGGQIGADQAGLNAGQNLGIETGGTAPPGWETSEGPQPNRLKNFGLLEGEEDPKTYPKRTEANVKNSSGTVWFGNNTSPGYRLTKSLATKLNKPWIENPTAIQLRNWTKNNKVDVLNVAGNRTAKSEPIISTITQAYSVSGLGERDKPASVSGIKQTVVKLVNARKKIAPFTLIKFLKAQSVKLGIVRGPTPWSNILERAIEQRELELAQANEKRTSEEAVEGYQRLDDVVGEQVLSQSQQKYADDTSLPESFKRTFRPNLEPPYEEPSKYSYEDLEKRIGDALPKYGEASHAAAIKDVFLTIEKIYGTNWSLALELAEAKSVTPETSVSKGIQGQKDSPTSLNLEIAAANELYAPVKEGFVAIIEDVKSRLGYMKNDKKNRDSYKAYSISPSSWPAALYNNPYFQKYLTKEQLDPLTSQIDINEVGGELVANAKANLRFTKKGIFKSGDLKKELNEVIETLGKADITLAIREEQAEVLRNVGHTLNPVPYTIEGNQMKRGEVSEHSDRSLTEQTRTEANRIYDKTKDALKALALNKGGYLGRRNNKNEFPILDRNLKDLDNFNYKGIFYYWQSYSLEARKLMTTAIAMRALSKKPGTNILLDLPGIKTRREGFWVRFLTLMNTLSDDNVLFSKTGKRFNHQIHRTLEAITQKFLDAGYSSREDVLGQLTPEITHHQNRLTKLSNLVDSLHAEVMGLPSPTSSMKNPLGYGTEGGVWAIETQNKLARAKKLKLKTKRRLEELIDLDERIQSQDIFSTGRTIKAQEKAYEESANPDDDNVVNIDETPNLEKDLRGANADDLARLVIQAINREFESIAGTGDKKQWDVGARDAEDLWKSSINQLGKVVDEYLLNPTIEAIMEKADVANNIPPRTLFNDLLEGQEMRDKSAFPPVTGEIPTEGIVRMEGNDVEGVAQKTLNRTKDLLGREAFAEIRSLSLENIARVTAEDKTKFGKHGSMITQQLENMVAGRPFKEIISAFLENGDLNRKYIEDNIKNYTPEDPARQIKLLQYLFGERPTLYQTGEKLDVKKVAAIIRQSNELWIEYWGDRDASEFRSAMQTAQLQKDIVQIVGTDKEKARENAMYPRDNETLNRWSAAASIWIDQQRHGERAQKALSELYDMENPSEFQQELIDAIPVLKELEEGKTDTAKAMMEVLKKQQKFTQADAHRGVTSGAMPYIYDKKTKTIKPIYNWYIPHLYKQRDEGKFSKWKIFRPKSSPRVKGRKYAGGFVEAALDGLEMQTLDFTDLYEKGSRQLNDHIADRNYMQLGLHTGMVTKRKYAGYEKYNHPGLSWFSTTGSINQMELLGGQLGSILGRSPEGWEYQHGRVTGVDQNSDKVSVATIEYTLANELTGEIAHRGDVVLTSEIDRLIHAEGDNDLLVTHNGTILRRKAYYGPAGLVNKFNRVMENNKLRENKAFHTMLSINAVLKQNKLLFSLFHNFAFYRSYVLGGPARNPFTVKQAYAMGKAATLSFNPYVEDLVRGGMTLFRIQDFDVELAAKGLGVTSFLKSKAPTVGRALEKTLQVRDRYQRYLFGILGSSLKTMAGLGEYKLLLQQNATKMLEMEPDSALAFKDELARMAAQTTEESFNSIYKDISALKRFLNSRDKSGDTVKTSAITAGTLANADFGGLNLNRMGVSSKTADLFRLMFLGPDWTGSNVLSMLATSSKFNRTASDLFVGADPEQLAKAHRKFWGRIALRSMLVTTIFNLIMAGFDDDDSITRFKKAWSAGNFRWLGIDITPIYKVLGGEPGIRKYASVPGHFVDPLKFIFHPGDSLFYKSSSVAKPFLKAFRGMNYKKERFTDWNEIFEQGTMSWDTINKGGGLKASQFFSWALDTVQEQVPIPVDAMAAMLSGQMDGFSTFGTLSGAGIDTTYPKRTFKEKIAE